MKYGIKSASGSASAHCRHAGAIYSSQSNNQSKNRVSGVRAINVSRVCAKTLVRIVQRIHLNFTFFSWIQNKKLESKFRKNQEVINHFQSLRGKNLKKLFGSGRNFLLDKCATLCSDRFFCLFLQKGKNWAEADSFWLCVATSWDFVPGDVYSFGIVMQEIICRSGPFMLPLDLQEVDGITMKELIMEVKVSHGILESGREKITKKFTAM